MATSETTSTTTDTKAAELAELVAQLVNSAEQRAREDVARLVLLELQRPKDEAKPKPAEDDDLTSRMAKALIEAQVMAEGIDAIARRGAADGVDFFPELQAIIACCMRLDAAVSDLIDEYQSAAQARSEGEASHV